MRTPLINEDGTVVNIIEYDGQTDYTPPDGLKMLDADDRVAIGGTYDLDSGEYTPPPEPDPPGHLEPRSESAETFAARMFITPKIEDRSLDPEDSPIIAPLFDQWAAGQDVTTGDIRTYGDEVYICLQAHTTQADWTPDVAASLWAPYRDSAVVAEWQQPTGATDAYPKGAKVLHNGKTWIADVDADVWEPGVSQWTELDTT
jgi:hypothetical protein